MINPLAAFFHGSVRSLTIMHSHNGKVAEGGIDDYQEAIDDAEQMQSLRHFKAILVGGQQNSTSMQFATHAQQM